jgi:hypothetical protein
MGNIIFYKDTDIGDVTKGRWRLMRQLLPVAITYVNGSMKEDWRPGTLRNVTVWPTHVAPPTSPTSTAPSPADPFSLEIFDDQSETLDEIHLVDAAELRRLFEWCDFLATRDGAYELIQPLIDALRVRTKGAFDT